MLKKRLSQHLLKDKNLLNKMVNLAGVGRDDTVVEIGPGQGDLTRSIAARAGLVYAIELDRDFSPFLGRLQEELPNVRIVFADVLDVDLGEFSTISPAKITAMGNIPYKITGAILFKLLNSKAVISGAYLTMQKEVADRLTGKPRSRNYGALSVIFQLYAVVKTLLILKPTLFIPPPKVESAFISIVFKPDIQTDRSLVDFIKGCFRYKRKYLKHSLEEGYDQRDIKRLYRFMGFPVSIRAEEIEPEGFSRMHQFLRQDQ